ncbi:hypothetical protein [Methanoregula sp.]|jgi:hypothetical protein|uniref:hypothetical protein n=1 Tax=Methanoregula sp. TaxID=2052170 RepID=UPI003C726CA9
MVNLVRVRMYEVKSRHSINFPSEFVRDSAFPFKPGDDLRAKIEDGKIIIEKIGHVSQTAPPPYDDKNDK